MQYLEENSVNFFQPEHKILFVRTPLCKISSTGEIEQRFRLN